MFQIVILKLNYTDTNKKFDHFWNSYYILFLPFFRWHPSPLHAKFFFPLLQWILHSFLHNFSRRVRTHWTHSEDCNLLVRKVFLGKAIESDSAHIYQYLKRLAPVWKSQPPQIWTWFQGKHKCKAANWEALCPQEVFWKLSKRLAAEHWVLKVWQEMKVCNFGVVYIH